MKEKGFTMIELLATITILGLIMLIAVPNVLSIIDKNKKRTYVEDAKKMQMLAEYKLRSTPTMDRPASGKCIVIRLASLDLTEFQESPEGGQYSQTKSFVIIANSGGTYQYYVTLRETFSSHVAGIQFKNINDLNKEGAIKWVTSDSSFPDYSEPRVGSSYSVGGTIQAVY